jgi:uncharacterized protein YciI
MAADVTGVSCRVAMSRGPAMAAPPPRRSGRWRSPSGAIIKDFLNRRTTPMFIVLLRFSDNKGKAGQLMEAHKAWIKCGFDDGVFVLVGSLQPNSGGGIVAHNTSLSDLQSRVDADPFVAEKVVRAEILEITPSRADARLNFLLD